VRFVDVDSVAGGRENDGGPPESFIGRERRIRIFRGGCGRDSSTMNRSVGVRGAR